MAISFICSDKQVILNERRRLKLFISGLFPKYRKNLGGLTYVFCSDDFLLDINRRFLKHDYYTDIVSFRLSADSEPIEGEIYISVDRVKENASILGVSFKDELHRVIFHGALHLCGLNDKKPEEKKKMTRAENNCLKSYFS
jgi:rRNA maturation RNase YbeY